MNQTMDLSDFWQIIAFSSELKAKQSLKKKLNTLPIILWRDSENVAHAVADVCSHKRSPLEVSSFTNNELTCPYHGWKYNSAGELIEIPSSPNFNLSKLNCGLRRFTLIEENGFIWVQLNTNSEKYLSVINKELELKGNWKSYSLQQEFDTNVELLIDNFMDSTHTVFIHKGIIRGMGEKVKHTVEIKTTSNSVIAEFAETNEKVAFGLRFLLGKNLRIRHVDSFLMPNIVKVDYYINSIHRFNALIVCSPISEGKTMALVKLSYNFKLLNPLVRLALPIMARKVIRQDVEITRLQYQNQQVFKDLKEHYSECDLIHNKVKLVRQAFAKGTTVQESATSIDFYL